MSGGGCRLRVLLAPLIAVLSVPITARVCVAVTTNSAAAIVVYPYLAVDGSKGVDTFVQLTNSADSAADVHCFYENTTAHCADNAQACRASDDCNTGVACQLGWSSTDFGFHLVKQQPIGWRISQGLPSLPAPGTGQIPAVPEDPFVGALRCVVVDQVGAALAADVLIGNATVEQNRTDADANFDVAKYNAVGLPAAVGDADGDGRLVLGGEAPEYQGCANTLVLDHFFDQAIEPVLHASGVQTSVALLPCSVDYVHGVPGESTVSFSVTNEFGTTVMGDQSFSVVGQLVVPLDLPELQVGAQGTLTGQMRLQATGAGVIATAFETHRSLAEGGLRTSAARTVPGMGQRIVADVIVIDAASSPPTATATMPPMATATPSVTPSVTATISPTATPTANPSATATPVRTGDLNHDGLVTLVDLQLLIAEVFDGDGAAVADVGGGTVASGPEADVNGDAVITSADFVALVTVVH